MKTTNMLFTGVGGQGTILTTKLVSAALIATGADVKMSEIHGMAQRGGTVNTQLKFGEKVYAPGICPGEADYLIAFEKAEALRSLPYLRPGGTVLYDEREIYSMPVLLGQASYPSDELDKIRSAGAYDIKMIPAYKIALGLGNGRDSNIVMLGAVCKMLGIEAELPASVSKNAYEAGKGTV